MTSPNHGAFEILVEEREESQGIVDTTFVAYHPTKDQRKQQI